MYLWAKTLTTLKTLKTHMPVHKIVFSKPLKTHMPVHKATKLLTKPLKTHVPAIEIKPRTRAEEEEDNKIVNLAPASEEASLTHPRSFASPARTNESKSKSMSRFGGVGQAGLAPPNLRFRDRER